jgi:tetratricopeptide (TPR) repeat protein
MIDALERCKTEKIVLHIRGIGGIGKSSLIDHWNRSIHSSVVLDCSTLKDFYNRLNILAKGIDRLGIDLKRFDVLWHIRQRYIEGAEPAKEEAKSWVMEIIPVLPVIGDYAHYGKALSVVGEKLKKALTGKMGELGTWLESRLGSEYSKRLLEVLWKEPSHAQFLFLDAIAEDLNNRKTPENPLLIMLDGYEAVDDETRLWEYEGRRITEAELWYVFLSHLENCVGVVASRQSVPPWIRRLGVVHETELTEIDADNCRRLLESRGIARADMQTGIVHISGGNPFVINCICDIQDLGALSPADIDDLSAPTLEQVRVKTWKRLFRSAGGLSDIIDRAGLVPSMNRRILSIIAPSMKSAHWDQLTQLSFVKQSGEESWALHALAKDLVLAELGDRLEILTDEVSELLREAAEEESDYRLLALSFSAKALKSELDAMAQVQEAVEKLTSDGKYSEALTLLSNLWFSSDRGMAMREAQRGRVCYYLDRVAEAEEALRKALLLYDRMDKTGDRRYEIIGESARVLARLGNLLRFVDRPSEAEASFWDAIARYRSLGEAPAGQFLRDTADTMCWLALLLLSRHRASEAEDILQEALEINGRLALLAEDSSVPLAGTARTLIITGRLMNLQDRLAEAEQAYRSAIEIYRGLAENEPESYRKSVGHTLHRLAYVLLRKHDVRSTMKALQEEIEIFDEDSKWSPLVYRKDRARALGSIGYMLYCTNRPAEAEGVLQESLGIFKVLAEDAPRAYSDSMASRLADLGRLYRDTNRQERAEESFVEALDIYRKLAIDAPEVYSVGECASCQVGIALQELAHQFSITDRRSQADAAYKEAERIGREIAANIPHHRHTFLVSRILHDFSIHLKACGQLTQSEESLCEALQGYEHLMERAPETYSHVFAAALNNRANLLRRTGRLSEAHKDLDHAVEVYRHLSSKAPSLFTHHLACVLCNESLLLGDSNQPSDAEKMAHEAVEIARDLVSECHNLYAPLLAGTLNNHGVLLKQSGRLREAEEVMSEAIVMKRELVDGASAVYLRSLATSLDNMGIILADGDRSEEAEAAFREALEIRQRLAALNSAQYTSSVASVAGNLHLLLSKSPKGKEKTGEIERLLEKVGNRGKSEPWSMEVEDLDIWFNEIFYHWADCPFCV